jgi:hypothetical protein
LAIFFEKIAKKAKLSLPNQRNVISCVPKIERTYFYEA